MLPKCTLLPHNVIIFIHEDAKAHKHTVLMTIFFRRTQISQLFHRFSFSTGLKKINKDIGCHSQNLIIHYSTTEILQQWYDGYSIECTINKVFIQAHPTFIQQPKQLAHKHVFVCVQHFYTGQKK